MLMRSQLDVGSGKFVLTMTRPIADCRGEVDVVVPSFFCTAANCLMSCPGILMAAWVRAVIWRRPLKLLPLDMFQGRVLWRVTTARSPMGCEDDVFCWGVYDGVLFGVF